jgi:lipoyl(octanoyl) transferase
MHKTKRIFLGVLDYPISLKLQNDLLQKKLHHQCDDYLLFLEHPPTITFGLRALPNDIIMRPEQLEAQGIKVFRVNRGGQTTFHGPGQLVCYPIFNLRKRKLSVSNYVFLLEEIIIKTLKAHDIEGLRLKRGVGVWLNHHQKIASIGINIKERISTHGFSLNMKLQHDTSKILVSCGDYNCEMISMSDVTSALPDFELLMKTLCHYFGSVLDCDILISNPEEILDCQYL